LTRAIRSSSSGEAPAARREFAVRAEVAVVAGEEVDAAGRNAAVLQPVGGRAETAAGQARPLVRDGEMRVRRLRQEQPRQARADLQRSPERVADGAQRHRRRGGVERRGDDGGEAGADAAQAHRHHGAGVARGQLPGRQGASSRSPQSSPPPRGEGVVEQALGQLPGGDQQAGAGRPALRPGRQPLQRGAVVVEGGEGSAGLFAPRAVAVDDHPPSSQRPRRSR
jgi:hypothetical protein